MKKDVFDLDDDSDVSDKTKPKKLIKTKLKEEPCNEGELNIGDWVVILSSNAVDQSKGEKVGSVVKIAFAGDHNGGRKVMTESNLERYPNMDGFSYDNWFRKALPHEIPDSIVNNYQIY